MLAVRRRRHHHVRVQVREHRRDVSADRDRRRGEGPPFVARADPEHRGEDRRSDRDRDRQDPPDAAVGDGDGPDGEHHDQREQPARPAVPRSRAIGREHGPSALRQMKVAPCSRHSTRTVSPSQRPYGVSRSQKSPVNFSLLSIGSPASKSPSATPSRNGTSADPTVSVQLQVPRQWSRVDLRPPLERDATDDQPDQDQHQGEVAR